MSKSKLKFLRKNYLKVSYKFFDNIYNVVLEKQKLLKFTFRLKVLFSKKKKNVSGKKKFKGKNEFPNISQFK